MGLELGTLMGDAGVLGDNLSHCTEHLLCFPHFQYYGIQSSAVFLPHKLVGLPRLHTKEAPECRPCNFNLPTLSWE